MTQKITVTGLILLAVAVIPVMAQQEDAPATLLPDIDPQDIEIRGEFDVRFQGLSRQPILGFSPRRPVFRVDPDRMPFIESDDEIVAAVPLSDLEPALKPEKQFVRFSDRRRGLAQAGSGFFMSPDLAVISEMPVRENQSLGLDFRHHSSEGDRDFSSFRDLNGEVQWTGRAGSHRWGLGVSGESNFNYSPLGYTSPVTGTPHGITVDSLSALRLSQYSFGMEGRWEYLENAWRGWQSSAEIRHFDNRGEQLAGNELGTSETRYSIDLNRFREGSQMEQIFGYQLRSSGAFYDTGGDDTGSWFTNTAGARYRHVFGHAHLVEAWLRFYQLYDPVNEFDLYLYPDVRYKYQGAGRFSATLQMRGFVNDPSLSKIYDENRFSFQRELDVEHERGLHIRLHSGIMIRSNLKAYTGMDYWQYYNLGYFNNFENLPWVYYEKHYTEDATHVEWYSGLTHDGSALRSTTTVEFGLNYSSVDKDVIPSGEIPYVPRWRVSAHFMTRPVDRLEMSTWLNAVGTRKTARNNETVDGYLQLGLRTDLRILDSFGVYFKALNLLDQEYQVWQNYNERPLQIYGGITLRW
ncbi:hypothetical protein QA596_05755 [Balneolales bacterium ANBcel1]|nr:hypothetical protein [Balneolales bacterium ANBcel1]